ncbi:uncharacterized protein LOC117537081 [Gymnodraco acuticeps]|uniref:Uncharacterized protein LOC117537081 n=1 Tax=Gymnodraco acuticeps TaxID=8218 RepID=A0A6P8T3Q7_GYMAC|nr:uncharacterized protein LOC117537081 [Gymnodraco acuticeps]
MEHPVFRRAPNGTLLLKATDEASTLAPRRAAGQALYRAKKPEEVDAEAWAHVSSEGGSTANATLVLSRWKVQFGQYQGKIFHWLLENDVGYAINLVASHQKERERTGSQSPLMANKDAFTHYSSAYPDFLEAVRFHRAFEEARAKSLLPGQEGQALVGFGDFKFETLDSLYESVDPKQIRFVNYLRRKIPTPGSQMENAICYQEPRQTETCCCCCCCIHHHQHSLCLWPESEDCIKASWFSACGLRVRAAFSVCRGTAGKDQEAGGP